MSAPLKPIVALSPAIPRKEARALARQLVDAGYLPLLADPSHIQTIDVLPVGRSAELAALAFRIIRKSSMHERTQFADAVLDMLEEASVRTNAAATEGAPE